MPGQNRMVSFSLNGKGGRRQMPYPFFQHLGTDTVVYGQLHIDSGNGDIAHDPVAEIQDAVISPFILFPELIRIFQDRIVCFRR